MNINKTAERYSDFLKNKKICLVGPSPHLIGSKSRDLIESFDLIVRLNVALPVPVERYDDIGKRTDILYNCLSEHIDNGGKIDFKYWSENIQWLASPYPKHGVFKKQMEIFENKNAKTEYPLKAHFIDTNFYIQLERDLGCRPNSGFAAIMDLLNHDIEELYVTGITFFQGGYDPKYRPKIEGVVVKDAKHSEILVNNRMNKHGNHRQKPQIEYMKKVFVTNNKLKGDEQFTKILMK